MHYHKPSLMELGVRAARAEGSRRRACISGSGTTHLDTCATGTFAGRSCNGGNTAGGSGSCVPGGATSFGDCINGTSVFYYCMTGDGASGYDYYGCVSGPTIT